MHEVGLMQAALAIALDQAAAQGACQIHALELHVGQQSGVVPAALAFAFVVVCGCRRSTGAGLRLTSIPLQCYCSRCQREFQPIDWVYECPDCHGLSTDIRQGQTLELASLEVS